jgi:Cdc6-like AAA superfamily ATPase
MDSDFSVNPQVLANDFIPDKVLHREKDTARLAAALGSVNTFVYGNTGIGKTLLLKKAIENLGSAKGVGAV